MGLLPSTANHLKNFSSLPNNPPCAILVLFITILENLQWTLIDEGF